MNKRYSTQDIYLAAAFLSFGAELVDTDKSNPRYQKFHFDPRGVDLDRISLEYANKTLVVNAVTFQECLRRMKSVVHTF